MDVSTRATPATGLARARCDRWDFAGKFPRSYPAPRARCNCHPPPDTPQEPGADGRHDIRVVVIILPEVASTMGTADARDRLVDGVSSKRSAEVDGTMGTGNPPPLTASLFS